MTHSILGPDQKVQFNLCRNTVIQFWKYIGMQSGQRSSHY